MISKNIDYHKILGEIETRGVHIIPNAFNSDFCNSIINWFDINYRTLVHESYYDATEIRIYNSEDLNHDILKFKEYSDNLLTELFENTMKSYSILAIRNNKIAADLHLDNRWHIDSFRQQIKTFLFLNDTKIDGGALEYFPKSNSYHFKLKMVLKGLYFKFSDVIRGTRAYTCIPDSIVESLKSDSFMPNKVIVKAGTLVIADTSILHRASPCIAGCRYALTSYYR